MLDRILSFGDTRTSSWHNNDAALEHRKHRCLALHARNIASNNAFDRQPNKLLRKVLLLHRFAGLEITIEELHTL